MRSDLSWCTNTMTRRQSVPTYERSASRLQQVAPPNSSRLRRTGHPQSINPTQRRPVALRAPGRDRGDEAEIAQHAARHEVKRNVAATNVEQPERVGDAEPDQAEQQQGHPGNLAERLRVGHTAGGREAADADHHMNQAVHEVDLEDAQQLVVEKAKDPGHEINGAEDGRHGLYPRSTTHCRAVPATHGTRPRCEWRRRLSARGD